MSLRGRPEEPWSLQDALDALVSAVRRAARPSTLWVAGFFYPSVILIWGFDLLQAAEYGLTDQSIADNDKLTELALLGLVLLVLRLPFFRLVAGLAVVTAEERWNAHVAATGRRPRLRDAWRAGEGLLLPAAGLFLQTFVMIALAFLVCIGPAVMGLRLFALDDGVLGYAIVSPIIVFLALYGLVLSLLYQLALHSLAQNRRGVGSAMLHAWRLIRRDPWATVRSLLVDGVLFVLVTAVSRFVHLTMDLVCLANVVAVVVLTSLAGITGVARASYWARTYRALGGVALEDRVPGTAGGRSA